MSLPTSSAWISLLCHCIYTYAQQDGRRMDRYGAQHPTCCHHLAANYHRAWGRYALNVNLDMKLQSKTYYTSYEDAPQAAISQV